jgi:P27 family predicted phage terminase small subunit
MVKTKQSAAKTLAPPSHLGAVEKQMWQSIVREHVFDETSGVALLRVTLEAHERARRCREAIDKDGMTFQDKFGQVKIHPLVAAERDARAAFMSGVKALRLEAF